MICPAVNFGAHELGHIWEKMVLANKDNEAFKGHVDLLNSIYAEWDALDPAMAEGGFNGSRDEYVGWKVQNYFAEGLGEFKSPAYNPGAGGNSLNPNRNVQYQEGDKNKFATEGKNEINEAQNK